MKKFYQIYLRILLKLHNYIYHKISHVAKRLNNNIHPKHDITNYHQFFLDNIEINSKVLEIGCGTGELAYDIAKKAQKVLAIDINKNSIRAARKKFAKINITYLLADATIYDFNENFDYIILSNVLEHIKDRNDFLKKIKNLTKYILIRVPMFDRSWLAVYKKEIGVEYRLSQEHYIEYTLETFFNEMKSAGLNVISYSIQFGEIWSKVTT